jgi:hypothetical protein
MYFYDQCFVKWNGTDVCQSSEKSVFWTWRKE